MKKFFMIKKLWVASALLMTVCGFIVIGCDNDETKSTVDPDYTISLASEAEPLVIELLDNWRYNEGYQGLLQDDTILAGGNFTKNEAWELDMEFTASRAVLSKLRVGFVDASEKAKPYAWWTPLSYQDMDDMGDMQLAVSAGLAANTKVTKTLNFNIFVTASSNDADANTIVFYADDNDGTKGSANSGTKGTITLTFTKFTLTRTK
ncbi:MAG: hypothetical protein LBH43_05375 [Treponema sp.]|jgi:hypothetical protein|nr:hypothetical protein [Treponema sp.]